MVNIWVPPDGGYITRAIIFILVLAVMAGIAQRITNIDRRLRGGLLALVVAVSVGIHVGLAPEHLQEMPRLGESFILASAVGGVIAIALLARPGDRRIAAAAGIFCLGEIVAWLLFVMIPVPFFPGTPEQVETIAVISKAVEAVGVVLAVGLVGSPLSLLRSPGSSGQAIAREPAGAAGNRWPDGHQGLPPNANGKRDSLVR
ncbi:MAG: hypothetical protein LBI49_07135 [Nocardiopsaceae bacterium]|jgi:hypothetical protein|nr:hypothetical protein [Nocardiopsaceae bacterium]